jgi:hypothetical protein
MTPEVLAVYLGLCLVAGILGRNRRIGFWGYFFGSIVFTPCIALVFLLLATPRKV